MITLLLLASSALAGRARRYRQPNLYNYIYSPPSPASAKPQRQEHAGSTAAEVAADIPEYTTPERPVDEAAVPLPTFQLNAEGDSQHGSPREETMDVIRKYWDYLPMSAKIALGASAVAVPAAAYAYNRYTQKPKALRKSGSRLRDAK